MHVIFLGLVLKAQRHMSLNGQDSDVIRLRSFGLLYRR